MIEVLASTAVPGWSRAEGTLTALPVGEASVAFMRHLQLEDRSVHVSEVRPDEIVLLQGVDGESRVRLHYKGGIPHLRFIREALWYYTRHPRMRNRIAPDAGPPLQESCELFRPRIAAEAACYPTQLSMEADAHWRCALLFAARVTMRWEIDSALSKTRYDFERLLECKIEIAATSRML